MVNINISYGTAVHFESKQDWNDQSRPIDELPKMTQVGLEPTTSEFVRQCYTNWAIR